LSGERVEGSWDGVGYRQTFRADGTTTVVTEDGEREEGRWKLDEAGRYCSKWFWFGWRCYRLLELGDGRYAWQDPEEERLQPFSFLPQ